MAAFDDHMPCPALGRWLVPGLAGQRVARWSHPEQPRWRPPRSLRRLLDRHQIPAVEAAPAPCSLDALIVITPLVEASAWPPASTWEALRPGGQLVDLSSPPRRQLGELLRSWAHTAVLREAAAMRMRQWLERGAYGPEQWATVDPAGVLLTIVRRAVTQAR